MKYLNTKEMKKEDFYFEILITDTKGKVYISNEDGFCHNLLSNNKLWSRAEIKSNNYIVDNEKGIRIHIKKTDLQKTENETGLKQVYTLTVNGPFHCMEAFRIPLLAYLKTLNFDSIYVLEDQISLAIAKSIYSSIYKAESFLRKYVIKFFSIKLGPEWWKLTADAEMQKKTNQRKNNETVFSEYVDNEVYLIDFGELGKLIYSQSSGNLSKDDIVNKVIKLENTVQALQKFKEEIQTNYNKFFKSTFKENNFQSNWEELEKIRHKIAHNNLFTLDDQERSTGLVSNLINTIKTANEEIDKVSFSDQDREYIMSSFIEFKKITKEVFLEELRKTVKWSNESADGFVGLQNFLVNILGANGYEFQATRDLVRILEDEKIIELYTYNSDKNERGVTAVRFKNEK
jgi:hypothetical protein